MHVKPALQQFVVEVLHLSFKYTHARCPLTPSCLHILQMYDWGADDVDLCASVRAVLHLQHFRLDQDFCLCFWKVKALQPA